MTTNQLTEPQVRSLHPTVLLAVTKAIKDSAENTYVEINKTLTKTFGFEIQSGVIFDLFWDNWDKQPS